MHLQSTLRIIIPSFLFAIFMSIPAYNAHFNAGWGFAQSLPAEAAGFCVSYMITFFHEIGHSITAWFYGIITIPTFDFIHGGGVARQIAPPSYFIMAIVNIGIGYVIYLFRGYKFWQFVLAAVILSNLITGFNEASRNVVIYYMGPLSIPLISIFFLYRALFDLCPKGTVERLLNATFGFAFIFDSVIEGFSLIQVHSPSRILYFNQKGGHGGGDFDKIASYIPNFSFDSAVILCIVFNVICLAVPFALYFYDQYTHPYNDDPAPENKEKMPKNAYGRSTYADKKYQKNTFGGRTKANTLDDKDTKP